MFKDASPYKNILAQGGEERKEKTGGQLYQPIPRIDSSKYLCTYLVFFATFAVLRERLPFFWRTAYFLAKPVFLAASATAWATAGATFLSKPLGII